jgi:hypothetical protein
MHETIRWEPPENGDIIDGIATEYCDDAMERVDEGVCSATDCIADDVIATIRDQCDDPRCLVCRVAREMTDDEIRAVAAARVIKMYVDEDVEPLTATYADIMAGPEYRTGGNARPRLRLV